MKQKTPPGGPALEEGMLFAQRYRLGPLIGAGGFARVYAASQIGVDRQVAIKILAPKGDAPDNHVEKRFRQEARLISKLQNPHTVVMYDYGRELDTLFMVFEYIDGEDLASYVDRGIAFSPARVTEILKQILLGLEEAHTVGILHRDIKPSNIMLYARPTRADCIKLLDFGVAKAVEEEVAYGESITFENSTVGTPRYMAPEQMTGDQLTPASDLFSVGLVCLELLTGARVFGDLTMREMHTAKIRMPLPLPHGLPEPLEQTLRGLLDPDPAMRFATARDALDALSPGPQDAGSISSASFPLDLDGGFAPTDEVTSITFTNAPVVQPADDESPELATPHRTPMLVVGVVVLFVVVAAVLLRPGEPAPEPDPQVVKAMSYGEAAVRLGVTQARMAAEQGAAVEDVEPTPDLEPVRPSTDEPPKKSRPSKPAEPEEDEKFEIEPIE